jgi:hypothetical protein
LEGKAMAMFPFSAAKIKALQPSVDTDRDYRDGNPCDNVKTFKETSRDRFLHPDELKRFFAALNEVPELFRDFCHRTVDGCSSL